MLWPGTLVNTQLTLRNEERVVVPAAAVQLSQAGSFVFVVKDNTAQVRPVKVERTVDGNGRQSNPASRMATTVVTDGQLLLSNGTRVTQRGNVGA